MFIEYNFVLSKIGSCKFICVQLFCQERDEKNKISTFFSFVNWNVNYHFYLPPWLEMRGMVGHVVNSMMTHISLPAILERVMHDPGYCDGNFAQIKHLLKGK